MADSAVPDRIDGEGIGERYATFGKSRLQPRRPGSGTRSSMS